MGHSDLCVSKRGAQKSFSNWSFCQLVCAGVAADPTQIRHAVFRVWRVSDYKLLNNYNIKCPQVWHARTEAGRCIAGRLCAHHVPSGDTYSRARGGWYGKRHGSRGARRKTSAILSKGASVCVGFPGSADHQYRVCGARVAAAPREAHVNLNQSLIILETDIILIDWWQ